MLFRRGRGLKIRTKYSLGLLNALYVRPICAISAYGLNRIGKMARPSIQQDMKTFTTALRKLGASAGNAALRTALGWTESRYWRVHSMLVEAGRVVKGRGR